VIIVDDPDRGITDDNLIAHNGGKPCKHLVGDTPGEYSCGVHDKPWYPQTPCFQFTQIEVDPLAPCRIGQGILKERGVV